MILHPSLRRKKPIARSKRPIQRSALPKRSGYIRPKKRSAGEFARIYGSKARVRWVKASPCVCCDAVTGHNHNHHTKNGGTGRKADFDTIVSLCPEHHDDFNNGRLGYSREWWVDQARQTQARWLEVSSG